MKDPYIGMPITMGRRCHADNNPPGRPPHNMQVPPGSSGSMQPPQNSQPAQPPRPSQPPHNSQPAQPPQNSRDSQMSRSQQDNEMRSSQQPQNTMSQQTQSDTIAFSGFGTIYLGSLPLAMAYTPMQQWKQTYSDSVALSRGTLFPELDLPFDGRTILTERAKGGRRR